MTLCLTRRTLPAQPLPRTRSISKSSIQTLRCDFDFDLEASDLRGFFGRGLGSPFSLAEVVFVVVAETKPGSMAMKEDSGGGREDRESSGMKERDILWALSGSAEWERGSGWGGGVEGRGGTSVGVGSAGVGVSREWAGRSDLTRLMARSTRTLWRSSVLTRTKRFQRRSAFTDWTLAMDVR